jgi:hypothetical protein
MFDERPVPAATVVIGTNVHNSITAAQNRLHADARALLQ